MINIKAKVGPSAKIGQGKAFKNKWISKKGNCLVRAVSFTKRKKIQNKIINIFIKLKVFN